MTKIKIFTQKGKELSEVTITNNKLSELKNAFEKEKKISVHRQYFYYRNSGKFFLKNRWN
jgi:uncharacterized protein YcfL